MKGYAWAAKCARVDLKVHVCMYVCVYAERQCGQHKADAAALYLACWTVEKSHALFTSICIHVRGSQLSARRIMKARQSPRTQFTSVHL